MCRDFWNESRRSCKIIKLLTVSLKYLGVQFDKRMWWSADINDSRTKYHYRILNGIPNLIDINDTIGNYKICKFLPLEEAYRSISSREMRLRLCRRKPFKLVFQEKVITAGFRLHYYRRSVQVLRLGCQLFTTDLKWGEVNIEQFNQYKQYEYLWNSFFVILHKYVPVLIVNNTHFTGKAKESSILHYQTLIIITRY